jgi:hypothetical protein
MSPRPLTALWITALFSLPELCGCAAFSGSLSDSDMESLKAVIAQKTGDPIIGIQKQAWGVVRVDTGVNRGPLNGSGWTYYLKRSGSTWKVERSVGWTS